MDMTTAVTMDVRLVDRKEVNSVARSVVCSVAQWGETTVASTADLKDPTMAFLSVVVSVAKTEELLVLQLVAYWAGLKVAPMVEH